MVWINEVDSAKHMDESKLSYSMLGRIVPDFYVLGSKIATALKKLLTAAFKRRVCKEKQKAQQDTRL